MSNKTFIPAFQCTVGDWKYYISMMKYGEVARQISFAHELSTNTELGQLVQRGLSARTKDITEYLLKSPNRFLGALVVAAWGGEPTYTKITMDDSDGMLSGLDKEFGVLTFDGTHQYFALDGQHRLRAIKDAVRLKPELGKEDICVLMVTHYDTPEGRIRTRRLFSNINRNAVKTAKAEDIVLDEDDGFAVLARRLINEHPFLKLDGRVKVITSAAGGGELKLAGNSIAKTDPKAVTTLPVLYDVIQYLGADFPCGVRQRKARPSDADLDSCYETLCERLDEVFLACGDLSGKIATAASAREVRGLKGKEGQGHPMMRPVIQKAVGRVLKEITEQGQLSREEVLLRLSKLDWSLASGPWCSVFNVANSRMAVGKDNTELLLTMLHAHLAPSSLQAIKNARRDYKEVTGRPYSISEADLAHAIVGVAPARPVVGTDVIEELSEVAQSELNEVESDSETD